MSSFLDKHIDNIYITESLEKALPIIKSKGPAIIKSISDGNLFQARKLLNTLPDASREKSKAIKQKCKKFLLLLMVH